MVQHEAISIKRDNLCKHQILKKKNIQKVKSFLNKIL